MILLPLPYKRFLLKLSKFSPKYPSFHVYHRSHFSKFLYCQEIHTQPNNGGPIDFFDHLLQKCTTISESCSMQRPVKQVHAQIILTSSLSSSFLSARLISVYSKLSLLNDAQKVFDTCPEDCHFSSLFWNSMLRANVSTYRYENAVKLYFRMRELGVQPDGFGFPLIIKACALRGGIGLCRIVHCHCVVTGFSNNIHVSNELLGMYGEIGCMEVAVKVFNRMLMRTRVSWNIMISGFAKNLDCDTAFEMFCRMENEGLEPNSVTWTSLISSFARCGHVDKPWEFYSLMRNNGIDATAESIAVVISLCNEMPAKGDIVHGHVIKAGFEKYLFVRNALISMYGRNSAVQKAEYLFWQIESKSIVTWNALISAYAQSGLCDEAFSVFHRLENSDENFMVRPNVVSWTAVINGFAASGRHEETLELFRRMQFAQVFANAVTIVSVLSVCAELSALPLGREIHAHAVKNLTCNDILIRNGLINMYMKCGCFTKGHSIFRGTGYRDINAWNIMITGYGMHGFGRNALKIFDEMVNEGMKPDEVTFVAVLSACSHSGLVPEGRELFHKMARDFQIEPRVEHYSCMVDLFGRAGLLVEASEIMKSMPMEPNEPVWGALLNSCKMHKNTDVAEENAVEIFNLDSEVTGSYMSLSNLYAASGRWDDSAKVRLLARTRGLRKIPGQSWIEVKKKVYLFSAGKALNLEMEEIRGVLEDLNLQLAMESSVCKGIFGEDEVE